jgi:hypothetical protein
VCGPIIGATLAENELDECTAGAVMSRYSPAASATPPTANEIVEIVADA